MYYSEKHVKLHDNQILSIVYYLADFELFV
jgi:hypothetical protein